MIRFRQLPQLTNTAASNTIWRAGSVNVADSAWHHLVVTYDGSSHASGVNIYEDGTLDPAPATVADNLTATTISTAALTIASRAAASQRFPSRIDDVAIYPAALNAARVGVHATAGRSDTAAVTTTYYPATPPANTCAGAAVAGLAAQTNDADADADGAGPAARVAHQAVYDTLGRTTGRQVPGDAHWSCTGYDTRGRSATGTDSAGHTVTNDYHDATNPGTVTQSYTDSAGAARTVTAVNDLLGRPTSYNDEQGGTTTATYDAVSRLTDTSQAIFGGPPTQLTHQMFDDYARPWKISECRPQTITLPTGSPPPVSTRRLGPQAWR